MQIFVRNQAGISVNYEVEPTNTIETLKVMVQDQEGIPSDQQVLFMEIDEDNRPLRDHRTLSYYGIMENSVLQVKKNIFVERSLMNWFLDLNAKIFCWRSSNVYNNLQ